MSNDSVRQLSNSFPNIAKTHVRYIVKEKVKAQVINSRNGDVIREIPRKFSPNLFENLYA